jgi:hypothetical protein
MTPGQPRITPGALGYSLSGLPSTGKSQLFQKSNGNYELVIWNNVTSWNFSAGTPITISPTTVTVNLASSHSGVNVYDPTSGATSISTASKTTTVNVSLTDHPIIVEIAP